MYVCVCRRAHAHMHDLFNSVILAKNNDVSVSLLLEIVSFPSSAAVSLCRIEGLEDWIFLFYLLLGTGYSTWYT